MAPAIYLLHKGWVAETFHLSDGRCQIVQLYLPGDIMGGPSLPYGATVSSLMALTAADLSELSLTALGDIFALHPRIGAMLFLAGQQESVFLMERLSSIGRTAAPARVAAFLLHLHARLGSPSHEVSGHLNVPLSQQQLGDALGLSEVHINRVLQEMERSGLIRRRRRDFEMLKLDALRKIAGIPEYSLRSEHGWLPAS